MFDNVTFRIYDMPNNYIFSKNVKNILTNFPDIYFQVIMKLNPINERFQLGNNFYISDTNPLIKELDDILYEKMMSRD